jgi:hypothetical protein
MSSSLFVFRYIVKIIVSCLVMTSRCVYTLHLHFIIMYYHYICLLEWHHIHITSSHTPLGSRGRCCLIFHLFMPFRISFFHCELPIIYTLLECLFYMQTFIPSLLMCVLSHDLSFLLSSFLAAPQSDCLVQHRSDRVRRGEVQRGKGLANRGKLSISICVE